MKRNNVSRRRGFALIAILWLIVAMAALGVDDTATARDALATTQNRMNLSRALWHAEACGEIVRATVDAALADTLVIASAAWDTLDRTLAVGLVRQSGCVVNGYAAGDRLDVNDLNGDALRSVFLATGIAEDRADSLADALIDWRDADSIPLPSGAESSWYRSVGRVIPANRPFQDENEIRLVRGFENNDPLLSLLGTEPGKIVLDRAPLPVIASLPGMTSEALGRISELRWRREPVGDIGRLGASLSEDARAKLNAAYPDLTPLLANEPDAWLIRISSSVGEPSVTIHEELKLVRAARRAGITRTRLWL